MRPAVVSLLPLAWGCGADPVAPHLPLAECRPSIEVARVLGFEPDSDERSDPRVQQVMLTLDEAGIPNDGMMGGVIRYDDGSCEDLFHPRGTKCGWYAVVVDLHDAARARAVLSSARLPTVPYDEASTAEPSPGLLASCSDHWR